MEIGRWSRLGSAILSLVNRRGYGGRSDLLGFPT